jgi:hypothetical protein
MEWKRIGGCNCAAVQLRRQLTDDQGQITLAKAYNPYGEVTQSVGIGQSGYGYTDEYQDSYIQYPFHGATCYLRSELGFL